MPARCAEHPDRPTLHRNVGLTGDSWRDQKGAEFLCTGAGTTGSWRQIMPATLTVDPAKGTFPVVCLIVNLADGSLKRHAGALSWEIQIGAGTSAKVGFHGARPTAQRASAIILANELRAGLIEKGLIVGIL
jgi:hypothetical protein